MKTPQTSTEAVSDLKMLAQTEEIAPKDWSTYFACLRGRFNSWNCIGPKLCWVWRKKEFICDFSIIVGPRVPQGERSGRWFKKYQELRNTLQWVASCLAWG